MLILLLVSAYLNAYVRGVVRKLENGKRLLRIETSWLVEMLR